MMEFLSAGLKHWHNLTVNKSGISIRYKILFLLTSIPLLTLAIYLVLAVKIFEEDKIAYVFDSSSSMSGSIAAQMKTQLNSVLSITRPIFQDFLLEQKFTSVGDLIFKNEFNVESISAYTVSSLGDFKEAAVLEKEVGRTLKLTNAFKNLFDGYLKKANKDSRLVAVPFQDDRVFLFEKVSDEKTQRVTIFLVQIKMSELAETFNTVTSRKVYLITSDGTVLFGPEQVSGKKMQSFMKPAFLTSSMDKIAQGVEAVRAADGTELLASFSRVGFADLTVVSSVRKKSALSAVQILIRKSLIFFGILISVTVIVSLFASNGLTQALTDLFIATKKVSEGNFDIRVKVSSRDEVGSLANNFNIMALEVSRLLEQTAEKARMESELQTAKTVQETLFPETLAKVGGLAISGYYEPASECGGDWWHYCQVGSKMFLWIGDATGHGAPAALITSAAKSAATIIETLNVSPAKAMELLNRSIYDVSKGRIMMTFFLASFDFETSELIYSNASHEAPLVIRKSDVPLTKNDLVPLNEVNNPRLGQSRDSVYQETQITLMRDDQIFFYTDGVTDIQDISKKSWGERAFIKALIAASKDNASAAETVAVFTASLQGHRGGATLIDDVTFFVVKNEGMS
jgi:sigma-B regulation protein RsbU (phosphoserine phosphatase)